MIFLTVGARKEGFARLVQMADELMGEGCVVAPMLIQIGHTPYEPRHASFIRFLPIERYTQMIRESTHVVCKGGAGTIMTVLRMGKTPIVCPVERSRGECGYDDPEILDLSLHLAEQGRLILVRDKEELRKALNAENPAPPPIVHGESLKDYIRGILEGYLGPGVAPEELPDQGATDRGRPAAAMKAPQVMLANS